MHFFCEYDNHDELVRKRLETIKYDFPDVELIENSRLNFTAPEFTHYGALFSIRQKIALSIIYKEINKIEGNAKRFFYDTFLSIIHLGKYTDYRSKSQDNHCPANRLKETNLYYRYIEKLDETKINTVVNNLKELKPENFKQGVITKITGHIPKFKFEYQLDIENDLKQLGVTNIFEEGKANLTEIIDDENVYIEEAIHKANIEFTEDGIKASATTQFGAAGGGTSFDYIFEVPVEEIDITFDKPYMFLIRDKNTGEVWFMGTVYEPLLWEDEPVTKLYNI